MPDKSGLRGNSRMHGLRHGHRPRQQRGTAMQESDHHLIGIHIHNRMQQAVHVQELLTQYGAGIKTRLGLHDVGAGNGLLVLEMVDDARIGELADALNALPGVEAQRMTFTH